MATFDAQGAVAWIFQQDGEGVVEPEIDCSEADSDGLASEEEDPID